MTWEYELPPDPFSISEARRHVRNALNGHTDPETVACAELVVSELVTNSVRHGPGEPIVLRLAADATGGIAGEIEDQGEGVVAIRKQDTGTPVGGLGLPLVERLTSGWGVFPGSTHVWFRFDP